MVLKWFALVSMTQFLAEKGRGTDPQIRGGIAVGFAIRRWGLARVTNMVLTEAVCTRGRAA